MNISSTQAIRVLVVDDHPVIRSGLTRLLSEYSEIEIVGEAANGFAALDLIVSSDPDVVLVDIKLEGETGLTLARQILHKRPVTKVIVLTAYDDEEYLVEAAAIGVHGYLLKSASPEMLFEAICMAYRGGKRLSAAIAEKAMNQVGNLSRELSLLRSGLSESDVAILRLLAEGATVNEIASKLNYCERTVKRKTQDILDKLGAKNRVHAVAEAIRRGVL